MADKQNDAFGSEIRDRLSDLFEEKEKPENTFDNTPSPGPQYSQLTDLKAILLSIEWEITAEILTDLLNEIERLKKICGDDKIIFSFLQLHASIGKYINNKKVAAHPNSVKLLHSVYKGLEKIVTSPEISEVEKKRILSAKVEEFKSLKDKILASKKGPDRQTDDQTPRPLGPAAQTEEISPQDPDTKEISKELAFVLEEIKKAIASEFKALREDLNRIIGGL